MKFLIVVTGYNCSDKVQRCYQSILAQTYENYEAVFIDDGSTDMTGLQVAALHGVHKRISIDNSGAAFRRYEAINEMAKDDDIVCLLGMDDELMPNALERVAQEYRSGKLVTYGNWINQNGVGLPSDFPLDFTDEIHEKRSYRKEKYRSTALNTFSAKLFKNIRKSDFMFNDKWIKATTESPTMFACLEMAGKDRIGIITEPIYIYNQGRTDNARNRFGNNYQDSIYRNVINLPQYPLYEH